MFLYWYFEVSRYKSHRNPRSDILKHSFHTVIFALSYDTTPCTTSASVFIAPLSHKRTVFVTTMLGSELRFPPFVHDPDLRLRKQIAASSSICFSSLKYNQVVSFCPNGRPFASTAHFCRRPTFTQYVLHSARLICLPTFLASRLCAVTLWRERVGWREILGALMWFVMGMNTSQRKARICQCLSCGHIFRSLCSCSLTFTLRFLRCRKQEEASQIQGSGPKMLQQIVCHQCISWWNEVDVVRIKTLTRPKIAAWRPDLLGRRSRKGVH